MPSVLLPEGDVPDGVDSGILGLEAEDVAGDPRRDDGAGGAGVADGRDGGDGRDSARHDGQPAVGCGGALPLDALERGGGSDRGREFARARRRGSKKEGTRTRVSV